MFTFHAKMSFSKEWTALINCYIVSPKGQWSNTVLDSWFLAVNSGSGNLDSGFQSVAVFRILELNFVIPIRIILHGAICFCFAVADYCKNHQCPQNATCVNGRESLQVQLTRVDWRPMWPRYTAKDKLCMLHHHYRHVGSMPEGHSLIWTFVMGLK